MVDPPGDRRTRMGELAVLFFLLIAAASAGSLKDIKHVVLFMQENRGFDHYFGVSGDEPEPLQVRNHAD